MLHLHFIKIIIEHSVKKQWRPLLLHLICNGLLAYVPNKWGFFCVLIIGYMGDSFNTVHNWVLTFFQLLLSCQASVLKRQILVLPFEIFWYEYIEGIYIGCLCEKV